MNEQYEDDFYEEDASIHIDWQALATKLRKGRWVIIITTAVFMALGLVNALTMTRKYRVNVVIAPEFGTGGSSSSLSSLASMLGGGSMMMNSSKDAYSVMTYPEVVASTPFLVDLFDIQVQDPKRGIDTTLVGYLTQEQGFTMAQLNPMYQVKRLINSFRKDEEADSTGIGHVDFEDVQVFTLSKAEAGMVNMLQKSISTTVDKKTGITSISVVMDNPYVAATVADSVIANLRKYITRYRIGKAEEDCRYYEALAEESKEKFLRAGAVYARFKDNNRNLSLNAAMVEGNRLQVEFNAAAQVYTQMQQQAAMAQGKVQEQKPVVAVIQPATVPLKPFDSRKKVLIIWTFMGLVLSFGWVMIGKDLCKKIHNLFLQAKESVG